VARAGCAGGAFADPTVQRFSWPGTTPYTEADARAYFVEQELARRRGESLEFALVAPGAPERVLGAASLYDVEREQRRARVGYWLAPEARGRGVATHAVRLLARWAFVELRLARLELTCGPDTAASQRVAERCGFVWEGVLRSHPRRRRRRRRSSVAWACSAT
jgi:RimJ/RimL family protein N-acetyltransferase